MAKTGEAVGAVVGLVVLVVVLSRVVLPRVGAWMHKGRGDYRKQLVMMGILGVVAAAIAVWSMTYTHAHANNRKLTKQDRLWGTGMGATMIAVVLLLLLLYARRRVLKRREDQKACKDTIHSYLKMNPNETHETLGFDHVCVNGEVYWKYHE